MSENIFVLNVLGEIPIEYFGNVCIALAECVKMCLKKFQDTYFLLWIMLNVSSAALFIIVIYCTNHNKIVLDSGSFRFCGHDDEYYKNGRI